MSGKGFNFQSKDSRFKHWLRWFCSFLSYCPPQYPVTWIECVSTGYVMQEHGQVNWLSFSNLNIVESPLSLIKQATKENQERNKTKSNCVKGAERHF